MNCRQKRVSLVVCRCRVAAQCLPCKGMQRHSTVCHVQVLDDSTDQKTRDLVDDKCMEWQERGVKCICVRRTNRKGYKAGALKDVRT